MRKRGGIAISLPGWGATRTAYGSSPNMRTAHTFSDPKTRRLRKLKKKT